jgi:GNAT superfamily N-acetyltransferase
LKLKSNLWAEGAVGYVDEMVVDASCRGRGVGAQILEQLIAIACERVELDSAFHRKEAHALYESSGFQSRALLFSRSL